MPKRINTVARPGANTASQGDDNSFFDRLRPPDWLFGRIESKTVSMFLEQFGLMIANGLSPGMALDGLAGQQDDPKFAAVLEDMNQKIHSGFNISGAMAKHPEVFPATAIMLIRSGEEGGDIAGRLTRAGQVMARTNEFTARIKGAVMSPLVTATVCGLVLFFIVKTVFPKFLAMYDQMDLTFPLISQIVFKGVNIVNHPLMLVLVLVFVILVMAFRKELQQRLFNFLLWLPFTRPFVGKLLCASMCEVIAFLHKDGVALHRILNMLIDNTEFKTHQIKLESCKKTLVTTGSLADAVANLDYFPPVFHTMISVGEESGSLDHLLEASQRLLEEEVDMVVNQVATILEPVVICGMGIVMGVLFIGMFLPIYGLLNSLGGI